MFRRMVKTVVMCSVLSLSLGCSVFSQPQENNASGTGQFEFALIGDTPYGVLPSVDYPPFDRLVYDVNSNKKVKWVLHAGDIKSGGTPCSDEMFYDRLERYNQFDQPFVLTLGDNEWTDCHRVAAGEYQPLERLAKLREVFFAQPGTTIGAKQMSVETQANVGRYEGFPENVMWLHQSITFSAIHIVGSQNGLRAFDPASSAVRTQADDDEVVRRTQAALAWLETTFMKAQAEKSPGVFIMIHANPGLERDSVNRTGFVEFLTALEAHTKAYGKPVMLAHGDSHYFRIDKPGLVESGFINNFTRIETFGSSRVHWLRVLVDPNTDEVFSVHQEIIEENN